MKTDSQLLQEVADRVTRIESRVVQLGDHVGANLRTKQRIGVVANSLGTTVVQIDALDVSLSRIFAEMKLAGVNPRDEVSVYLGSRMVAQLYFD